MASKSYKPILWLATTDENNLSLWSGREVLTLRSVLQPWPLPRGIYQYLAALLHRSNYIPRSFQAHSVRTLWNCEFLVTIKGYNAKLWINVRVICGNHNSIGHSQISTDSGVSSTKKSKNAWNIYRHLHDRPRRSKYWTWRTYQTTIWCHNSTTITQMCTDTWVRFIFPKVLLSTYECVSNPLLFGAGNMICPHKR